MAETVFSPTENSSLPFVKIIKRKDLSLISILLSEVFLNPKTSTAKKLIYSGKVNTDLSDDKFIRLTFSGNTDEPLIANIVQDCNILVSIVYANTWLVEGKIYGQLILKLPSKTKDINKLKTYLDNKKVEYSEVSEDEFRKSI